MPRKQHPYSAVYRALCAADDAANHLLDELEAQGQGAAVSQGNAEDLPFFAWEADRGSGTWHYGLSLRATPKIAVRLHGLVHPSEDRLETDARVEFFNPTSQEWDAVQPGYNALFGLWASRHLPSPRALIDNELAVRAEASEQADDAPSPSG